MLSGGMVHVVGMSHVLRITSFSCWWLGIHPHLLINGSLMLLSLVCECLIGFLHERGSNKKVLNLLHSQFSLVFPSIDISQCFGKLCTGLFLEALCKYSSVLFPQVRSKLSSPNAPCLYVYVSIQLCCWFFSKGMLDSSYLRIVCTDFCFPNACLFLST